MADKRASKPV